MQDFYKILANFGLQETCKVLHVISYWVYLRPQDLRPQDLIRWKTGRDGFTLDDYFKYSGNCNYLNVHYQ